MSCKIYHIKRTCTFSLASFPEHKGKNKVIICANLSMLSVNDKLHKNSLKCLNSL